MLFKLLKNKVVKNASWLIAGRIFQMIISFFVGLITARYLGPSNYGLIGYAGAYTAFFTSLCTLGINSVLVKEFVDNPGEEGKILGTSILLRIASSLLSSVTIICISCVIDAGEPVTILVVALCSIGVVFHVFEVFNYWFQSRLKSKVTTLATLIAYLITSIYKIFLIITGKSIVWFAFATSVDYICVAVILYMFYKKHNGKQLSFSWSYAKKLLSKSRYYILPGMMVAIYGHTDKMMIKQLVSETEIGYYSVATALCTIWCFVLAAIIDSMYPTIMEANKNNSPSFVYKNKLLYAIVFYVSIFVSLFFTVFADFVIGLLYGSEFQPAAAPLRVITWYTAFSYLGVARQAWIICKNKQKYLFRIYVSSAVVNVVLNLIFIPRYGAVGAATASLITQIATILIPYFMKDLRENTIMILESILLIGVIKSKKHNGGNDNVQK